MAIIQVSQAGAAVQAQGVAKSATVNVSGALMEMLATTYTHILLAAIREAIQNACDAARRKGLSLEEGVLVTLPTQENPVLMVADKGEGMTGEFMETTYLSFGSSTKSGDNGAAGGLGVGRWAAYGYIRECVIATCHESDLQERTYFQFQGADGIPQVQLASINPGDTSGTKISFPVKDKDVEKARWIIAWLKDIMQLTLGDSFSVDTPATLPSGNIAEDFSGTILDLGRFDPSLDGVRVYPLKNGEPSRLADSRRTEYGESIADQFGSLVVLTNRNQGIGGLPFKVESQAEPAWESVFFKGMIIEIPMSFGVPFMPSREELRYTDDLLTLMAKIDRAAQVAVVARVAELFKQKDLKSKFLLNQLLGHESRMAYHWFQFATHRSQGTTSLHRDLSNATGGTPWSGQPRLPVSEDVDRIAEVKLHVVTKEGGIKKAFIGRSRLLSFEVTRSVLGIRRTEISEFFFDPVKPVTLIYDDLRNGGTSRVRAFLKRDSQKEALRGGEKFVFIKTKDQAQGRDVAQLLSATYGGDLRMVATSSLPEVVSPRKIIGSKVVRTDGMRITYYDARDCIQGVEYLDFSVPHRHEPIRYWVCKVGANIEGYSNPFSDFAGTSRRPGFFPYFLREDLGVDRLYLLTPKQRDRLIKQIEDAKSQGLFDMAEGDFDSDDDGLVLAQSIKELKTWMPLEDGVKTLLQRADIQSTMRGENPYKVVESTVLNKFVYCLVDKPRLALKDTLFDSFISPYVDAISGTTHLLYDYDIAFDYIRLCERLVAFGDGLFFDPEALPERRKLLEDLKKLETNGVVNYREVWESLKQQFPILRVIDVSSLSGQDDDVFEALALMYR